MSRISRPAAGQSQRAGETGGVEIRLLGPGDAPVLANVHPDTFDNAVIPAQARAFLASPLHRIVVALDRGQVIGMATGAMLLHPDKAPAFFINEVGVADDFRRRGIGRQLTRALIAAARSDGARGIWLATEDDNMAARGLYAGLGARVTRGIVVYDWDGAMDD